MNRSEDPDVQARMVKFHWFPNNPELPQTWKHRCKRTDAAFLSLTEFEELRVCSDHFLPTEYVLYKEYPAVGDLPPIRKTVKTPQLRNDAVPSQYPSLPGYMSAPPASATSRAARSLRAERRASVASASGCSSPLGRVDLNTSTSANAAPLPLPPPPVPAFTISVLRSWLAEKPLPTGWHVADTAGSIRLYEVSLSRLPPAVRRTLVVHSNLVCTALINNESRLENSSHAATTTTVISSTYTYPALKSPSEVLSLLDRLPSPIDFVYTVDDIGADARERRNAEKVYGFPPTAQACCDSCDPDSCFLGFLFISSAPVPENSTVHKRHNFLLCSQLQAAAALVEADIEERPAQKRVHLLKFILGQLRRIGKSNYTYVSVVRAAVVSLHRCFFVWLRSWRTSAYRSITHTRTEVSTF